ncbi:MAG: hypothetical protein HYV63_02575 [Candidatus Schekmanbacteria bacterium]|nr:hypothetical protein [Candidatus Schekmanbacteria bacterium]
MTDALSLEAPFAPERRPVTPSSSTFRELRHVASVQRLAFKNLLQDLHGDRLVRVALALVLAVSFALFSFVLTDRLVTYILAQESLGGLRLVLLSKLTSMLFLLFLLMLTYSNIVGSLSALYLSEDLWLLLSSPIRVQAVFWSKAVQTLLTSSWMVVVFGLPVFFAYGVALDAEPFYFAGVSFIVGLFVLAPWAAGVTLSVLLMRFLPARRTRQMLGLTGLLFAIALIVAVRLMQPADVVNQIGMQALTTYLEGMRVPEPVLLPSTWAMEAVMGLIDGSGAGRWTVALLMLSGTLITLAYVAGGRLYLAGYHRSVSGAGRSGTEASDDRVTYATVDAGLFIPSRHPPRMAALSSLLLRELRTFVRDSAQWSQAFILLALVFLFVLNFYSLPHQLYDYQHDMVYVGTAGAGFIGAAVLLRFGLTAVSLEGDAHWVVRTSPLLPRRYLWSKFVWNTLPVIVLALILTASTCVALDAGADFAMRAVLTGVLTSVALGGLSVGLGASHPRFRVGDPSELAFSIGGILFMVAGMAIITAMTVFLAVPDLVRLVPEHIPGARWLIGWGSFASVALQVPVAVGVAASSLRSGWRQLARLESP